MQKRHDPKKQKTIKKRINRNGNGSKTAKDIDMKVSSTYTIDLIGLGAELGVRKRDLECLTTAGATRAEFKLNTPFVDGCIDGHIMVNPFEFTRQLTIISRALEFPFCMGSYKILSRGILDELERYSESDEAIVDATEAYQAELAQMREDFLEGRAL